MNSLLTDCHWPGESQAQMSVKRQYERRRSSVPSPEQSVRQLSDITAYLLSMRQNKKTQVLCFPGK